MSYKISIESKIDGAVTLTTFSTDSHSISDVFEGVIGQLVSHSFPIEAIKDEIYRRSFTIYLPLISDMDDSNG